MLVRCYGCGNIFDFITPVAGVEEIVHISNSCSACRDPETKEPKMKYEIGQKVSLEDKNNARI